MAEALNKTRIASTAVQLPSRPSNTDCLTWSAEHLACAAGEFLHLIDTTTNDLRFDSVRINHFSHSDTKVEPANGADFSIGREQSTAKAISISFSAHGLGIHSRAVLAVLTANHIVSFWEHTGKRNSWHRTCLFNNMDPLAAHSSTKEGHLQIHAFAWLPPVCLGQGAQQAVAQFVSFIDCNQNLWTVQVSKKDKTTKATWKFSNVHKVPITVDANVLSGRPLITSLAHNVYAFDAMQAQDWQLFFDDQGIPTMARIRLIFKKQGYRPDSRGFLSAIVTVELEDGGLTLSSRMAGFASERANTISPQDFMDAVAEPANNFDKEWNLHGHYAIHWLGFATSLDRRHVSACVVFKPSASPSYTQPRDEKSTVLIAPTNEDSTTTFKSNDPHDVQLSILQHLASITDMNTIATDTDIKIVHLAIKMIRERFSGENGLMEWSKTAEQLLLLFESEDGTQEKPSQIEVCEICRIGNITVPLDISEDGARGKCATGHGFYRCGITFLAVQDPGICKHCVRCKRQFLCIKHLESEDGPSLGRTLLDESGGGLCPYCQGYFSDP